MKDGLVTKEKRKMKAWKIHTDQEWYTDTMIIITPKEENAIKLFLEVNKNDIRENFNDEYPGFIVEEWDIGEGDVIFPAGYDFTDATIKSYRADLWNI